MRFAAARRAARNCADALFRKSEETRCSPTVEPQLVYAISTRETICSHDRYFLGTFAFASMPRGALCRSVVSGRRFASSFSLSQRESQHFSPVLHSTVQFTSCAMDGKSRSGEERKKRKRSRSREGYLHLCSSSQLPLRKCRQTQSRVTHA